MLSQSKQNALIRPFEAKDYERLAHIRVTNDPKQSESAELLQYFDNVRPADEPHSRFVAESNGVVVGYSSASVPSMFEDRTLGTIEVQVLKEHRKNGFGHSLFSVAHEWLRTKGSKHLNTWIDDNFQDGIRFAKRLEFLEEKRRVSFSYDLKSDFSTDLELSNQFIKKHGIEIVSYPKIANTPHALERLYELNWNILKDVPFPVDLKQIPFEDWKNDFLSPSLVKEAWLIAVKNDAFVGHITHYANSGSKFLTIGITGVERSERGKGVAKALKVAGMSVCKTLGYESIFTQNDPINGAIVGLNHKLKFKPEPDTVVMKRQM